MVHCRRHCLFNRGLLGLLFQCDHIFLWKHGLDMDDFHKDKKSDIRWYMLNFLECFYACLLHMRHADLLRHPFWFIPWSPDSFSPSFVDVNLFRSCFPQSYFNWFRLCSFAAVCSLQCCLSRLITCKYTSLFSILIPQYKMSSFCFYHIFSYPGNDMLPYI